MQFCTAINCMDGRVQLPVIKYLQQRFNAEYVDAITEAGPNRILSAEENVTHVRQNIFERVALSIEKHNSVGIAIVGHHDCAGNPVPQVEQIAQIQKAAQFLRQQYKAIKIIGLWVDENWDVHEVTAFDYGLENGKKTAGKLADNHQ